MVDIGADTTTISVYYSNILRHLVVIPLGGSNVTTDISTKSIELGEAEQLKLKYGTAWHESEEEPSKNKIQLSYDRTITEGELYNITEARYEEIIVNIWAHIKQYNDKLLSGILLTGGASKAKNLVKAITEYTQTDKQVRLVKGMPMNISHAYNVHIPEDNNLNTLMALLLKGDQNCVGETPETTTDTTPVTDQETVEVTEEKAPKQEENVVAEVENTTEEEKGEEKPKKDGGVSKKIRNMFGVIKKMLTDPEEEEEIIDEN